MLKCLNIMISDYITISFCGAQCIFPNDSMFIKPHKSPAAVRQKGGQKGLAVTGVWEVGKDGGQSSWRGPAGVAPPSVTWGHRTYLPMRSVIG